jgi:hypothetical protein
MRFVLDRIIKILCKDIAHVQITCFCEVKGVELYTILSHGQAYFCKFIWL